MHAAYVSLIVLIMGMVIIYFAVQAHALNKDLLRYKEVNEKLYKDEQKLLRALDNVKSPISVWKGENVLAGYNGCYLDLAKDKADDIARKSGEEVTIRKLVEVQSCITLVSVKDIKEGEESI